MATVEIRYVGPYETIELALGASPLKLKRGETIQVNEELAEGLLHGAFELVDQPKAAVEEAASDPAED